MEYKNMSLSKFNDYVKCKKIICVGAGKIFEKINNTWPECIVNRIVKVVDNYKSGQVVTAGSKKYHIDSVTSLAESDLKDCILLITSIYCKTIYEQLTALLKDAEIECYIAPAIQRLVDKYEIVKSNTKPVIPKVIHYFWVGDNEIPEDLQKYIATWKKFCPDYEIIKWTEDNYDITKCKYMKQAYDNKKWAFVPDYARLDVLYEYGGIYLDTDVELIKSLDDLLYEDAFMGFESFEYVAAGLGFGCKKGNDIIGEMRDLYNEVSFLKEDGSLNLVASPVYQTDVLKRHNIRLNNSYQKLKNITIFPTDVLAPMDMSNGKLLLTPNTHSIHHYKASWLSSERKKELIERRKEVNYFL